MTKNLWENVIGEGGEGVALIGEVVAWTLHGETTRAAIEAALEANGLDKKLARILKPRDAFARACHQLEESRIIRPLRERETPEDMHFQFTAEVATTDEAKPRDYQFETILTLKKSDGHITCSAPELTEKARVLLANALQVRNAHDVTNVVHRLFKQRAKEFKDGDLFAIRENGAVYFVMSTHSGFLDAVEAFLKALGGDMARLPIPAGTAKGDATVREVVARGLGGLVKEHEAAVEAFGDETRESTMERQAKKITATREKIEAYAAYLGEQQGALMKQLNAITASLRAKVAGLASDGDSDAEADEEAEEADEPALAVAG